MIDKLTINRRTLNFARAFAAMAAEIRPRRRREDAGAAAIRQSILPGPLRQEGDAALCRSARGDTRRARLGGDFYGHALLDDGRLANRYWRIRQGTRPLFMAVSRTVLRSVGGEDLARRMAAIACFRRKTRKACS